MIISPWYMASWDKSFICPCLLVTLKTSYSLYCGTQTKTMCLLKNLIKDNNNLRNNCQFIVLHYKDVVFI